MNERGFVAVSMRKLERIKIIAAVAEHRLKVVQAAERLERIVARTEIDYSGLTDQARASSQCCPSANRSTSISRSSRTLVLNCRLWG